jgi:hypothetical protein
MYPLFDLEALVATVGDASVERRLTNVVTLSRQLGGGFKANDFPDKWFIVSG